MQSKPNQGEWGCCDQTGCEADLLGGLEKSDRQEICENLSCEEDEKAKGKESQAKTGGAFKALIYGWSLRLHWVVGLAKTRLQTWLSADIGPSRLIAYS